MAESTVQTKSPTHRSSVWMMYSAPTIVFILLTLFEEKGGDALYPWIYSLKIVLVTITLWFCRSTFQDFKWNRLALSAGLAAGVLVFAFWIPLDKITPFHFDLSARSGFNPFQSIPRLWPRVLFLTIRFYGLVIMIPLVEELFWRSFLPRFITNMDGDFQKLEVGEFSVIALLVSSLFFGLAHPEWLSGILCGIVYGYTLRRTRSLYAPLIAHSLTNLLLGIAILHTHAWIYW